MFLERRSCWMKRKERLTVQTTERRSSIARAGSRLLCGSTDADLDFDARAKAVEDRHQAIHGEAREVRIANSGEVRRGDSGTFVGCADREAVAVEDLDNFSGEDCFELIDVGVWEFEIAEYVAASVSYGQLLILH